MKKSNDGKGRLIALIVLCALVFAAFLVRLVWMQWCHAEEYQRLADLAGASTYRTAETAARGMLTDRTGTVLAQDAPTFDAVLVLPGPSGAKKSPEETIKQAVTLLGGSSKDVETQLAAFSVYEKEVSAGEFLLARRLDETDRTRLAAAGLLGSGAIRLRTGATRVWPNDSGSLAPQQLGTVGPIPAETWQQQRDALRQKGYTLASRMGRSGLEAALEPLLRGQDGVRETTVCLATGEITAERTVTPPQPGQTVVLTLDSRLQRTLQRALSARLAELQATKAPAQGREACAGAAVAVDVRTGGVLAAVSWPGYDLANTAGQTGEGAPQLDRVRFGLYAPGSAFKPAVAAAALQSGTITTESTVNCTGAYFFYAGYQPHCLQISHHGPVCLHTALQYSCNIFFYDTGRRLGVDAFSDAAHTLGLAADPGAELSCAAGSLTRSTDPNYQAGLTLQAAIGQGNTAVTPLQLASYAAALANDGSRLRLHFVAETRDARSGHPLAQKDAAPEVLSVWPGGKAVFGPIREGMKAMAQTLRVLRESPVPIACKTGSPQVPGPNPALSYTNSVLIGYAPADDPQLAVAVVLEYGGGGANAAPIFRAAVEEWFS